MSSGVATLTGRPSDRGLPAPVPEHIEASWRRSVKSGVSLDRLTAPLDPDIDADGPLVRAARPVLDDLARELRGARVAVVLSNERGQVVDRRLSEPWLHGPVVIEGRQHFAEAPNAVACAGAPIADPGSGRIVGVLDLTCLAAEANPLMLPLVTRAAREIEHRLVDGTGFSERLALRRFLQQRRGAKGPLVMVTERTVITNAAAERLVQPDDEPILRDCATRLANGHPTARTKAVLSGDTAVDIRAERVVEGGVPVGTILRLTRITDGGCATHRSRRTHRTFGWDSLTETERSVMALVAEGMTNREVAERLFLSHHTVGFHLRSIFRKLGISSRVDLTRLAVEHGRESDLTPADRVAVSG